ncbi:MAG TPA: hypothetical protein VGJ60_01530 [Chloroflexota bacterium]|jgi:hypothetical protein
MSNDDLNTLLQQFSRAMVDPTAPLPTLWPVGAMGVFLVFATQIGAGIPLGVLMARNAGINPLATAGLYAASDVVLALTMEPMLIALRWLGQRVEFIGRLGNRLSRLTGATGLSQGKVRGPLGLILFSFAVAPAPARAASEAAGHGFISGWTLAIIGDMFYFTLIMASTLWISSVFGGDDRFTVGAVLVGAWVLPMLIRRMRPRSNPAPPRLQVATAPAAALSSATAKPTTQRKAPTTTHNGRRRRSSRARREL